MRLWIIHLIVAPAQIIGEVEDDVGQAFLVCQCGLLNRADKTGSESDEKSGGHRGG